MSWTKLQLITGALDELGMSDYLFDSQPQQLQVAAMRLESMIMTWGGQGINIGWNIASNPDNIDLSVDSGLQLIAAEAVMLNLAIRLAPAYGKAVSLETKASAKQAFNQLVMRAAYPRAKQRNNMVPAGAGYKYPFQNFLPVNQSPLDISDGGFLELP